MTITVAVLKTLVNDTGTPQILTDDEYQSIIDLVGSDKPFTSAQIASLALSAAFAQKVETKVGPVSISNQQKSQNYRNLATSYKTNADASGEINQAISQTVSAPSVTGISLAEIQIARANTDRYQSAFFVGMDNNPEFPEQLFNFLRYGARLYGNIYFY